MLDVLERFHSERALLLFVQDVKRKRLAIEHLEALRALKVFIALVEYPRNVLSRLDRIYEPSLAQVLSPACGIPLEAAEVAEVERRMMAGRLSVKVISQSVIDEVGKIVADAELSRHTTPSEPTRSVRQNA